MLTGVLAVSVVGLFGTVPLAHDSAAYTDPKGRFRFDLAAPFELKPRFGDVDGIRLLSPSPPRRGGGSVIFELRVVSDARCARGRPTRLGRSVWRSVALDNGMSHARTVGGRCLEASVIGSSRAQRRVSESLRVMLASVRPGQRSRPSVAPSKPSRPTTSPLSLAGRWVGLEGGELVLLKTGRFTLGALSGLWRVAGRALVLEVDRGRERRFRVGLRDGILELSGGGLDAPTRFRRAQPKRPAESPSRGGPVARAADSADPRRLVGRWRATLDSARTRPGLELELDATGRFRLASTSGQWRLTEVHQLELVAGPTAIVTYRWAFEDEMLILSGADLDAPVRLRRVGGPSASR